VIVVIITMIWNRLILESCLLLGIQNINPDDNSYTALEPSKYMTEMRNCKTQKDTNSFVHEVAQNIKTAKPLEFLHDYASKTTHAIHARKENSPKIN
jgi:hypothetical protein